MFRCSDVLRTVLDFCQPGNWGTKKEFNRFYTHVIDASMQNNASGEELGLGTQRREVLGPAPRTADPEPNRRSRTTSRGI